VQDIADTLADPTMSLATLSRAGLVLMFGCAVVACGDTIDIARGESATDCGRIGASHTLDLAGFQQAHRLAPSPVLLLTGFGEAESRPAALHSTDLLSDASLTSRSVIESRLERGTRC